MKKGDVQLVLLSIIALIMALILIINVGPLSKGQAENLVFSTAFAITENIADSVDFLGATRYNGTVEYKLPNVDCQINLHGDYVFVNSSVSTGLHGKVGTTYSLFTNSKFISDEIILCENYDKIIIEKNGTHVLVSGE